MTPAPARDTGAAWLLGVALIVFILGHLSPMKYVGLLLPLGAALVLARAGGERLGAGRVPVPVLLLVGWLVASYAWSADPASTRQTLVGVVVTVSVALAAGLLLTLNEVRRTTTYVVKLVLVVTVAVLLAFPRYSTTPSPGDPVQGWHSIFSHKNALGGFLVLATVCLAVDASRTRPLWLLTCAVLVVGSQSSTATAIVLVVYGVLAWRSSTRAVLLAATRAAYRVLSLMLVCIGAVVLSSSPGLVTDTFGRSTDFTGRTEIWTAVQRQIELHPWHGFGWGGVWTPQSVPTLAMWREARFQAFYAHSGYLDVVLQIGVVGAALYLAVVLPGVVRLLRRLDGSPAPVWSLLIVLAQFLGAFSESAPFTGGVGMLFLLLLPVSAMQRPGSARLCRRHRPVVGVDVTSGGSR